MSQSDPFTCHFVDGCCQRYGNGHNTHCIHANHVGRTPWGWRDGLVVAIAGRCVTVDYLHSGAQVRLWHHEDLSAEIAHGQPVRVHEQYHVLGGAFGWVNVNVDGGLGAVPAPADPSTWAGETTCSVVDMTTGRAVALDWSTTEEP